ncbi:MAG TPA: hypothetical protein PKY56_06810 [Candidatus Kapabacteria bacterium]|nr:hypothetical protein [Candidatus Kapabacteria bacterium]HPO62215.1 hypothetical protein [Candidatus Kapabacteria bacterium]
METLKELTPIELQKKGLEALTKDLGISGAVQFIKLYAQGSGDWTKERYNIVPDLSVESIADEIISARKK